MARGVALEQVGFAYEATPVLDDVTLDVGKGEFFAFLGPSGSGKTTLLRLIAGFGTPDRGRILIGERDVTRLPPWSRNVGLVFQSYALWPHMSVAKNVAFGLERRKFSRAEIERKVREALDLVDLAAFAERRPAQLSGGQQQRVALARTLVIEPDVLLLDEPLSNLDAKLRVEMRGELRALQRKLGITAVYVTHDQEEANAIADRIAVLDQGRIQQIGAPVELYDHPANRFVATFLGTANLIDGRLEAGGRFVADSIAVDGISGPAGPACISVRPQDVTVTPAGQGIGAKISEREFLGGIIRYRMRIGAQEITVDVPHRRDVALYEVGAQVGLIVDPRQVSVLPSSTHLAS
jgi:iron(III) transport system ATP-binding protein